MLYLVNADNIYFPQIKEYFREIISSYDNGNYRSAMVMLYSTIVCDLLLKLKELSDVYNDTTAENLLNDINKERRKEGNSSWEWKLIKTIKENTELLSDESYTMIAHVYDLRNFSAHPAMNDEYELISPTPEMTVAYIKKALNDIFIKPSVFAQNIVNRMSDDVSARKDRYLSDFEAFETYLVRAYFQRMSSKMSRQVFKAFWKFTLIKTEEDGEVFEKNRNINRRVLEAMLNHFFQELCDYVEQNQTYFTISPNSTCLGNACILFSYFPQLFNKLDDTVKDLVQRFSEKDVEIIKWFVKGDLEEHITNIEVEHDVPHRNLLVILEKACKKQGQPGLFTKFLINHYSNSCTYTSARNRFDNIIEPYLKKFGEDDFVQLLQTINSNSQIYNYCAQRQRNDRILDVAKEVLPADFDFSQYQYFKFTADTGADTEDDAENISQEFETIPDYDPDTPF